jgi:hypothetical protein
LALARISVPFVPPGTAPPWPVFGTLPAAVFAPVLELFGATDRWEPAALALPENSVRGALFGAFEGEAVLPAARTTAGKGEFACFVLCFPGVTEPGAAIAAPPIASATTNRPSGEAPTVLIR